MKTWICAITYKAALGRDLCHESEKHTVTYCLYIYLEILYVYTYVLSKVKGWHPLLGFQTLRLGRLQPLWRLAVPASRLRQHVTDPHTGAGGPKVMLLPRQWSFGPGRLATPDAGTSCCIHAAFMLNSCMGFSRAAALLLLLLQELIAAFSLRE